MSSTQLSANVEELSVTVPVIFGDLLYHDLSSDYTAPGSRYIKGVYFRGDVSGKYRCVTLAQFHAYGGDAYRDGPAPNDTQRDAIITAAVNDSAYVDVYLAAYQWVDCPVMFIESTDAAGTNLNIGIY